MDVIWECIGKMKGAEENDFSVMDTQEMIFIKFFYMLVPNRETKKAFYSCKVCQISK